MEIVYSNSSLEEVAFFDVFPQATDATFDGTWSNYPWLKDGKMYNHNHRNFQYGCAYSKAVMLAKLHSPEARASCAVPKSNQYLYSSSGSKKKPHLDIIFLSSVLYFKLMVPFFHA